MLSILSLGAPTPQQEQQLSGPVGPELARRNPFLFDANARCLLSAKFEEQLPTEPCQTYFQEFSRSWMHALNTNEDEELSAADDYQGWPVRAKEALTECHLLQKIVEG